MKAFGVLLYDRVKMNRFSINVILVEYDAWLDFS